MSKLPSIALIHGWATDPTIWNPVRDRLAVGGHKVTVYEMPGYGSRVSEDGEFSFDQLVADASEKLNGCNVWVGWSLGAMIAIEAAKKPNQCRGLFAVCPTAKFCSDADKENALNQLQLSVDSNAEKAVKRFQRSMPSAENRKTIGKELGEIHAKRSQPSKTTLLTGLEILATTDLTSGLNSIEIPVRIVSGEQDSIIPSSSGEELHRQIANSTYTTLPCGHVPFLECPQLFMEQLVEFTQSIAGSAADSEPV